MFTRLQFIAAVLCVACMTVCNSARSQSDGQLRAAAGAFRAYDEGLSHNRLASRAADSDTRRWEANRAIPQFVDAIERLEPVAGYQSGIAEYLYRARSELGVAHVMLLQWQDARNQFEAANELASRYSLDGLGSSWFVQNQVQLSQVYENQGLAEKAVEAARTALVLMDAAQSLNNEQQLQVLTRTGSALSLRTVQDDNEEEEILARAETVARLMIDQPLRLADVLGQQGRYLSGRGREAEAAVRLQDAIAIYEAQGQSLNHRTGPLFIGLGYVAVRRGDGRGAAFNFGRAVEVTEASGYTSGRAYETALAGRGVAFMMLGKYSESEADQQSVLDLVRERAEVGSWLVGSLSDLALVMQLQNNGEMADAALREARDIGVRGWCSGMAPITAAWNSGTLPGGYCVPDARLASVTGEYAASTFLFRRNDYRALRQWSNAAGIVLERTLWRFGSADQAQTEYRRSGHLHRDFISGAWGATYREDRPAIDAWLRSLYWRPYDRAGT